jgi:hypothetical protein
MIRNNFKFLLVSTLAAALFGCGGSDGPKPAAELGPVVAFDQQVYGTWAPSDSSNEVYEFFSSPQDEPYQSLKTGKIYNKSGTVLNSFFWNVQADGSIKLNKIALNCGTRPLNLCPVASTATIVANGNSINHGKWTFQFDDNKDGVADRKVVDVYDRKQIDMVNFKQGEFYLARSEYFATPLVGSYTGTNFTVRMVDTGQPVMLSANASAGLRSTIDLVAGEASATVAPAVFDVKGMGPKEFPVKSWYSYVQLSAAAAGGFLMEFEVRKQLVLPAGFDKSLVDIGTLETPVKKSRTYTVVNSFVKGPTVNVGETYNTFMILDFDPTLVAGSSGSEVNFQSATQGTVSHRDFNADKYSEFRPFTWTQSPADGSIVFDFGFGIQVNARFVKKIPGGYQVLFAIPDPYLGVDYVMHDWILQTPAIIAEKDVPGRYKFLTADGFTQAEVTFHKDKTVSGVVDGFWFLDSNGDVVGFECYDKTDKLLRDYAGCLAAMNDLSKVNFMHIRRLRFMSRDGDTWQVKYNANFWGTRVDGFGGVTTPNYFGIAWTYRFIRIGDE